jgi:hypothetical protein
MRCARHVARMGEKRNAYRILVGKTDGKRTLERPRRRWVDNIKMDLGEIGWDGVDWIDMAQDRDQLLWTRYWTLGFHKMLGSSWVAAQLVAPQEGLSSVSKYEELIKTDKWT